MSTGRRKGGGESERESGVWRDTRVRLDVGTFAGLLWVRGVRTRAE